MGVLDNSRGSRNLGLASGTRGRAHLITMLPPLIAMPFRIFNTSNTLDAAALTALAASSVRVVLGCFALRQLDLNHRDLTLDPLSNMQWRSALYLASL
ncbi:hypothetical protein MY3296_006329 [Beauveria thailandica]